MKKTALFIIVAVMILTMAVTAYAVPSNLGIGFVPVPYTESNKIKIDGNINSSEWSETNSLLLSCKTNMATWTTEYLGNIRFFYSWGDDGLYMAAKVIDSTHTFTTMNAKGEEGRFRDRFHIAFNPCGLIYEKAKGLGFSFYPVCAEGTELKAGATGDLHARKHDFAESDDESESIVGVTGFKGAFKVTEDGWDMEAILPWNLISSQDRVYDIIDFDTEGAFCSVLDPKNEDRTRAFTKAMIAYIDTEKADDEVPRTARTAITAEEVTNWSATSYDITFKFFKKGENTNNKTVTKYTVDELKTIFKNVDWRDWDEGHGKNPAVTSSIATEPPAVNPPVINPPVINPPVTNSPVTDVPTTDAPTTDAPTTDAPVISPSGTGIIVADVITEDDEEETYIKYGSDTVDDTFAEMIEKEDEESSSKDNVPMITIAIVAVVVATIAIIISIIMAVIITKRKKNG